LTRRASEFSEIGFGVGTMFKAFMGLSVYNPPQNPAGEHLPLFGVAQYRTLLVYWAYPWSNTG
jgi:hypothetical protein